MKQPTVIRLLAATQPSVAYSFLVTGSAETRRLPHGPPLQRPITAPLSARATVLISTAMSTMTAISFGIALANMTRQPKSSTAHFIMMHPEILFAATAAWHPTTALLPSGKQIRQKQQEQPSIPLLCRQALTAKTPLRPVQPMQPRITTQSLQPTMLKKS